jgi:hypothetical protein
MDVVWVIVGAWLLLSLLTISGLCLVSAAAERAARHAEVHEPEPPSTVPVAPLSPTSSHRARG